MNTLTQQITAFDTSAPWTEQLADIKAVVDVLQVESLESIIDRWMTLTEPLNRDWFASLRMEVVKKARSFVNDLATTCSMAMGQFVDELVVSCVDSARSHAQVLCKAGEECMTVRSSPSRYNVKKLRHHFDPTRGDQVRLLIVHQLELIVQSWKKTDLDLHYQDITSVLAKALHDKNDQIRAIARGVFCLVCSIWEEHLDDLVDLPMSFEITTEPADDNAPFTSIAEASDICNMSQAVDSTRHIASDTALTYSIADATPKRESVSCPRTTNKSTMSDDGPDRRFPIWQCPSPHKQSMFTRDEASDGPFQSIESVDQTSKQTRPAILDSHDDQNEKVEALYKERHTLIQMHKHTEGRQHAQEILQRLQQSSSTPTATRTTTPPPMMTESFEREDRVSTLQLDPQQDTTNHDENAQVLLMDAPTSDDCDSQPGQRRHKRPRAMEKKHSCRVAPSKSNIAGHERRANPGAPRRSLQYRFQGAYRRLLSAELCVRYITYFIIHS
ncbi:hypothetical protein Ae201684_010884 [Aphanomyces euteiches]|uniref:CLASP N-terminal domain-containing protein n=1 Tax=Aphanomyces euteiches TaxID=100861 RepID=A0A6G0WWR5_9STRA|nr:hypothetical protein Ae201684_010884 [Aphanomyces euteiches]